MLVERFAKDMVQSDVFKMYIGAGFFGTMIFFVFNAHIYTPYEMLLGTILVTIGLKGISNMMISLLILLFNLKSGSDKNIHKIAEDRINLLLHQLEIKEAELKLTKKVEEIN